MRAWSAKHKINVDKYRKQVQDELEKSEKTHHKMNRKVLTHGISISELMFLATKLLMSMFLYLNTHCLLHDL